MLSEGREEHMLVRKLWYAETGMGKTWGLLLFFFLKIASFSMMSQDRVVVCHNKPVSRSCCSKSRGRTCTGSSLPMLKKRQKEAVWQKRAVGPRELGLCFSSSETALTLLANSNYSCWKENIFDISWTFPWDMGLATFFPLLRNKHRTCGGVAVLTFSWFI